MQPVLTQYPYGIDHYNNYQKRNDWSPGTILFKRSDYNNFNSGHNEHDHVERKRHISLNDVNYRSKRSDHHHHKRYIDTIFRDKRHQTSHQAPVTLPEIL